MAWNHVAQSARLIVVGAPVFHPQALRNADLHMVNVSSVPHWFDNAVGKSEDQNILNRLFTEVMIDPIDLILPQILENLVVKILRGIQIASKRLLNDEAAPLARALGRETAVAELLYDVRK